MPIEDENAKIVKLVEKAKEELGGKNPFVDAVVFPETSLSKKQFDQLELQFQSSDLQKNSPSIIIAGVRESREDIAFELNRRNKKMNGDEDPKLKTDYSEENKLPKLKTDYNENDINFNRNAVYCKYFDQNSELVTDVTQKIFRIEI
jgi:hypothetical protein